MYRNSVRFFAMPLLLLVVLRTALKLLFVDNATGFYMGGTLLAWAFGIITAAAIGAVCFFAIKEREEGCLGIRGNRALECIGVLFGAFVAVQNGLRLIALLSSEAVFEVNVLARPLRAVEYGLGVASGLILLWIAASFISGAAHTENCALASLVIVCWHALVLVERFISFRQVSTVSDQFLETAALLLTTFFWLEHAKSIAGEAPSRARLVMTAFSAALTAVPLAIGQLAACFLFGETSGPDAGAVMHLLLTSAYMTAFVLSALHRRDKAPRSTESA